MRKGLLLIFVLAVQSFAQDGMLHTWGPDSTQLDSTEVEARYVGFYSISRAGTHGIQTTAITPKNGVRINDQAMIVGYADSLLASGDYDSLSGYFVPLDPAGYVIDDTLWFDFANNDTAASQQWLNFTPWNRSAKTQGTDEPTFWIDLSGMLKPYPAGKVVWEQITTGQNTTTRVRWYFTQGLVNYRD